MASIVDLFKTILMIQLVFFIFITILGHYLPDQYSEFLNPLSESQSNVDINAMSDDMEDLMEKQQSMPSEDVGGLALYSGNLLISLFVNFLIAVPAMFVLLITYIGMLVNVDPFLLNNLKMFTFILIGLMYIFALVLLLVSLRTGRQIV